MFYECVIIKIKAINIVFLEDSLYTNSLFLFVFTIYGNHSKYKWSVDLSFFVGGEVCIEVGKLFVNIVLT